MTDSTQPSLSHSISFSNLLESGNIPEALELRLEAIEATARHYRQDLEAAKLSSAALGIVGAVLSLNPLVGVLAGAGLLGYGYTVLQDFYHTKRFCPLPLVRKTSGDLFAGIGLAATGDKLEEDPLDGVIGYVDPDLAHEYELLNVAESRLVNYLYSLPPERRLAAYRHMLRHTKVRNRSLELPEIGDVATALGGVEVKPNTGLKAEEAKKLAPVEEVAANTNPLSQWLAQTPVDAVPQVTIETAAVPIGVSAAVFHSDPLINELVKATLKSLASRSRSGEMTDTVEFVNAVDGYKFWRLVFRKLPQVSADALLKSSQNLYSDLGVVLPDLAKAPLIAQIKGGKFAVDAAKPMSDWRTAYFRDYIVPENWSFESPVRLPVGVDLDGTLIDINLSNHNLGRLLVGGSPGGGKSNFGVAALCAIACQYSPSSVKLLLSDVQQVELNPFKKLPHLYAPVASTPEETIDILELAEEEMDARQALFAAAGVNNIDGYNATVAPQERLPRVVVLIEEMADIVASSCGNEFNELQNRFLRLGRKWGFYWIGSTQTPRREVIPPEIRALYAAFLAFMCTRPSESKILLGEQDESACQLLGYGDGIFMSNLGSDRVQTLMVESQEVKAICDRVIATYGSYQPRKPRVVEQNNLDTVRERLEDALNLPFDGEEVPDRPADQPTSRPTNPITPPKKQNLSNSLHRPTDQPTDQEDDWDKFGRIKRGRMAKPPVSKTKLIQELFNITYDSGNGFDRYERQYYEIIEQFDRDWIIELLQDEVPERLIVEIVWSRKKLNADYDRYLEKVTQIKEEIEQ